MMRQKGHLPPEKMNGIRPNILYIHSHDTGRYIEPFGIDVPTPNLSKLADEGLLFRKYFTTHPTSSASRASLLTGTYPHNNGMIGLAHRGFALRDPGMHLVNTLKKYGYLTLLSGVQHVMDWKSGEPSKRIGYDRYLGDSGEAHIKAAEWLDHSPSQPFFMSVGFDQTHRKYPEETYRINASRLCPPKPFPDIPEIRKDMAMFAESVKILDDKMGTVFSALERNNLLENTLIICTTDHGIAFPEMKCNLYDGGTGIFLIMRGPGGFKGGRVIDSLVSVIDVFPTLCELLNIEKPGWLEGESFLPLISGEKQEIRDAVYAQVNYHASYEPMRSVRTERWKYIRRYGDQQTPVLPNCDDGPTKTYWIENGWKDQILPREELFDLCFDPHERRNLALDPRHSETLAAMRLKLEEQMKRSGDPMLKGYIKAPPTARLNNAEGISPSPKSPLRPLNSMTSTNHKPLNMKKFTFLLSLILLIAVSCSKPEPGSDVISLTNGWKFKTGDNPQWASPTFDDASWKTMIAGQLWEHQGFEDYDGFGWYRIKVFIPSSLKKNAYFKDSLQFSIGKVDDDDETFLNGKPLGYNGKTIENPDGTFPAGAEQEKNTYNIFRNYVIPAGDPRILWDQDNVIAVRVNDTGGGGGLYTPKPSISMVDLKDYITFDIYSEPFDLTANHYSKTVFLVNRLKTKDISGDLTIKVSGQFGNEDVYHSTESVTLPAGQRLPQMFTFEAPQTMSYKVEYIFTVKNARNPIYVYQTAPYILTPPTPDEARINGPGIFGARPGSPFMYNIPASGKRPMTFEAEDLPYGLSVNPETGIITGKVYRTGDYHVTLKASNALGTDTLGFTIRIGNTIALTPPLGWNSWNVWGLSVDDAKVRNAADMMKKSGLADFGWTYINIDDGWESAERNARGEIGSNEKFPDMKALTGYVHSQGLKTGIYSSPGPKTCGGYLGSYQHECQDARTWADWGFDYIKYDWCSYGSIAPDNSLPELQKPYILLRGCLDKINRDIVFSLCQYGMGEVWKWGAEVGGNLWRTTGDITDTWESMSGIGFNAYRYAKYAVPGHWNDVDMMVVGWVGWGPSTHPTRLTPDEQYTHVSLWSLLSAPMLLGCDLTRLDDFTLNLLTNTEVLAVHQDALGIPAGQAYNQEDLQVWTRPLEDGSIAVGFFNLSSEPKSLSFPFSNFGMDGKHQVRDLWRQKDLGEMDGVIQLNIPIHGVLLTKFSN